MTIEYRDGSFSENMPVDEALEKFQKQLIDAQNEDLRRHVEGKQPRALHIGTDEELNKLKTKSLSWIPPEEKQELDLQAQIDELREKVESLELPKSNLIEIPTKEQIRQFVREDLINRRLK